MVPGGAEKKVWTVRRKKDEKRVTVHGAEKPGPEDHPGSGERDEPDAGRSSFCVASGFYRSDYCGGSDRDDGSDRAECGGVLNEKI